MLRILLLTLHLQQELFLILQGIILDLDTILHQFLLLSAQIDRFIETIIVVIIHKLPINITIHSIITFLLHQTQILIQISTKIILNLIRIQQHKTLSYNYHKPVPHSIIYILKIRNFVSFNFLFSYHTIFSKKTSKPSTHTYTN